jgi:uncharacterized protein DUF3987
MPRAGHNPRDPFADAARALRQGALNGHVRVPEIPPIDLRWLTPLLAEYCQDLADTWKQPADAHVTAALAALLVAIGGNVQLLIPGGDDVPACDWFALVGRSGTGKTPIMRAMLAPLRARQREMDDDYRRRRRHWQTAIRKGGAEAREAGDRPIASTLIYDDTTFEAMTVGLSEARDTGSVWYSDELLGLFNSLDAYKQRSGRSMQGLLTMWRAEPIRRQRVKDGELTIVGRPVVSILGGIQPSKLYELGTNDDGRLARILPIPVVPGSDSNERDPDPHLAAAWSRLLLGILDSRPASLEAVTLREGAAEAWRRRAAKISSWARGLDEAEREIVLPFVAKLEQHVGRLAVACWAGHVGRAWPLPALIAETVEDAWNLGEVYLQHQLDQFGQQAYRAGLRAHEIEQADAAERFHRWLTGRFTPPVSQREVQRAGSRWLRGADFRTVVEGWRKRGYGAVLRTERTALLSWDVEPPEAPK